ncbi:MAG: sugar-binding protein [Bacteroidota bacterium]
MKKCMIALMMVITPGVAFTQTVNTPLTPQADTFTIIFDVTPSVAPLNGGVGVSGSDVAGWGDMGAIIGFTPDGIIRARNGAAYQQLEVMNYEATKAYHVVMTVDVPGQKYSATITPDGGSEVVMAYEFGFRAAADPVNNYFTHNDTNTVWGGVHGATLDISNFVLVDSVIDISYGIQIGTVQSIPITKQTGRFVAELNVLPSHNLMNSAFALSADTAAGWGDLSPIVRFGTNGFIDVRDGANYAALQEYKYSKDKTYGIRMEVDVFTNTYDVYVTDDDNKTVLLAKGYRFRIPATELNFRVVNIDTLTVWGGIPGSTLQVTNFSIDHNHAKGKIYRTETFPAIDGDISDGFWEDIKAHKCQTGMSKELASEDDLGGYWKAVWTSDALYLMALVEDDSLFDNGAPTWNTDGVHIYWGLLNNRNGLGGNAVPPADSSKVFSQFYFAADSSTASGGEVGHWLPGVSHVIVPNDTGYVLEVKLPWEVMNQNNIDFSAEKGTKILFDVNLVDSDNDGWWSELQWSSNQNNWASMTGAGELELDAYIDLSLLASVIDSSIAVVDAALVGSGNGEYTQESVDAANAAITTAKDILDWADDQAAIDAAVSDLRAAMALFVPITVSVQDFLSPEFSMYPVPVIDLLHIRNVSNVDLLSLYSVSGKLIQEQKISGSNVTLDLSGLNSGMYIVKFATGHGQAVKGIVKQ